MMTFLSCTKTVILTFFLLVGAASASSSGNTTNTTVQPPLTGGAAALRGTLAAESAPVPGDRQLRGEGEFCKHNFQCDSGLACNLSEGGALPRICQPGKKDGAKCTSNGECASGLCAGGLKSECTSGLEGQTCTFDRQCDSGSCKGILPSRCE